MRVSNPAPLSFQRIRKSVGYYPDTGIAEKATGLERRELHSVAD